MIDTQNLKSLSTSLVTGGIAFVLFSLVAVASVPVVGWVKAALQGDGNITEEATEAPASRPAEARAVSARNACGECGVIDSTRTLPAVGNTPAFHEITVRMSNGTTQVISDAGSSNWRPGERIKLIGSLTLSGK